MPSRCVLGCNAGSLLDRRSRPVLPEYTYNVIRKYNSKTHLSCLIDEWLFAIGPGLAKPYLQIIAGFIGLNGKCKPVKPSFIKGVTK